MANLSNVKNFRFSSSTEDELGYCLTSIETAIKYIWEGSLFIKLPELEGFDNGLFLKQRMSLLSQMSSIPVDHLFKHIASGNQKEVERPLSHEDHDRDAVQKMCHPLCFGPTRGYQSVTLLLPPYKASAKVQDNNGSTPLHLACT
ncbi:Ankyrin repeat domain-containing protein 27 [Fukomys damarensis]|uniref:Ankyrin repeat domain-containing protein 27 n=1 Tax=Fukomys damarensis TaxID=885580 RepID=A0A091DZB1_FUKDA|nr:Ankyrin repeat domain-containing protein 27 [Fukomys damarensis]